MTTPGKQLELIEKAIRQIRWAMANTLIALFCAVLAFFVFLVGYMLAGVLIIAAGILQRPRQACSQASRAGERR